MLSSSGKPAHSHRIVGDGEAIYTGADVRRWECDTGKAVELKNKKTKVINHIRDLNPDTKNFRRHTPAGMGMIEQSLKEVGAARSVVIDENNVIMAGNAAVEAAGNAGIARVRVIDADGTEIIAVRRKGLTDKQKTRLALFDNRTNELSDFDNAALLELHAELPDMCKGIFSDEYLAEMQETMAAAIAGENSDNPYTSKVESPIYTPKGDKPKLSELFDLTRYSKLIAEIDKSELADDEKAFLRFAACRHIVFNYQNIAEYYSHLEKDSQNLFENSALVIIDFKKAIELGFVRLTQALAETYSDDTK